MTLAQYNTAVKDITVLNKQIEELALKYEAVISQVQSFKPKYDDASQKVTSAEENLEKLRESIEALQNSVKDNSSTNTSTEPEE